jgi:AraC-like DNA-binding protein
MAILAHKIEWLFEQDIQTSEIIGSIRKFQFPYSPELAIGYTEHLEISTGITLIKSTHHFENEDRPSEFVLGKYQVEFSSPTFISHMVHSGSVALCDNDKNNYHKRTPKLDMLGRFEFLNVEQTLFTEEDIFLSALFISEIELFSLLGSEAAENLYKNLNLLPGYEYREKNIPKIISNKIANSTPDHLEGNMRLLFAQSIILQYLIELNLYISSSKSFLNNLEKDDFDVSALLTELLQVTADIPNLAELSKKYNVSPGKLNQAFVKKYDQSIYSFLSNQRLDQAFRALLETEVPMKMLAHKIGYSHVNHFITAFKKKFGVTPGSVRNQSREKGIAH